VQFLAMDLQVPLVRQVETLQGSGEVQRDGMRAVTQPLIGSQVEERQPLDGGQVTTLVTQVARVPLASQRVGLQALVELGQRGV